MKKRKERINSWDIGRGIAEILGTFQVGIKHENFLFIKIPKFKWYYPKIY